MDIAQLRRQLDQVDATLIKLLARRKRLVLELGRQKQKEGIRLIQRERERQVLRMVTGKARGHKVDAGVVTKVYKILFAYSHRLQRKSKG